MNIIDNDLLSMQEARILVENAREAQKKLATFPQEKLDEIVERMVEEIEKHSKELAKMSNEETEYGKWEDKYIKNSFVCRYLKNRLKDMKCVGVIDEDKSLKTMDVGVPMGVIVAFCPSTSPVSTTIYKALIAIKSGNAIIFSPHKRAKNTIAKTIDILIRAAEGVGLPEGALAYLHTVSKSGSLELMNHRDASLIMNTGVPEMLDAAYKSGKPVIYGGNGNGPAFIERTADIKQAVKDIIDSKNFDYGVVSSAEQSIVVDSCIASEVKQELIKNGAYFMTAEEAEKLAFTFLKKDGGLNVEIIGKSPQFLAKNAGFSVPEDTKLLISKQKFVSLDNPYSREKFCPVLAFYIEDDWMHACEKCIELLLSERHGHTLVIHSKDEEVIRQFALKKPVGRVLVNTPATFGSMGATTNLFPSMTLGSGSAGDGMTSDNVSPMNLIYVRKVGYGVRKVDEIIKTVDVEKNETNSKEIDNVKLLESILKKVMNDLK
ncbi:aldehyde dehydrogenase family protein [Clostridium sp. P21]|uniref:Aldehyde dehydrogenase family protein n=1 Tax=Clostridium muellerianum TaxID=2716538 RepID=A0A7Y0HPS2_9CLOT|nr:aldehyde dehydrogenase family protein [Clostridium muellerianum]NMM65354.1 aldehyde dehydrogenase family protein [Clostridium muellerianum]